MVRSRSGNFRNFSHGLTPNDSVSRLYDQHLGNNSLLRSPMHEQPRVERKKLINPSHLIQTQLSQDTPPHSYRKKDVTVSPFNPTPKRTITSQGARTPQRSLMSERKSKRNVFDSPDGFDATLGTPHYTEPHSPPKSGVCILDQMTGDPYQYAHQ